MSVERVPWEYANHLYPLIFPDKEGNLSLATGCPEQQVEPKNKLTLFDFSPAYLLSSKYVFVYLLGFDFSVKNKASLIQISLKNRPSPVRFNMRLKLACLL
jgi:hypothetical protein